ncbi:hypothetical protein TNCV_1669461 [Trichonephila clavipes]|nr:hypothetical protein TNCV_1669461 [Trichonephila clavipes]
MKKQTYKSRDVTNRTNCNCGDAAVSCYLVNGNKICECINYFAQRFNQCALCDCGKNGENCSFDASGEKQCECFPGFSMGNNGRCVEVHLRFKMASSQEQVQIVEGFIEFKSVAKKMYSVNSAPLHWSLKVRKVFVEHFPRQ